MVQFYEVTVILSIIIGWLLREFFINFDWGLWKWIMGLLLLVIINEKSGGLEKVSKWLRKREAWLYIGFMCLLIALLMMLEKIGVF